MEGIDIFNLIKTRMGQEYYNLRDDVVRTLFEQGIGEMDVIENLISVVFFVGVRIMI
jgi:hypothetical protein